MKKTDLILKKYNDLFERYEIHRRKKHIYKLDSVSVIVLFVMLFIYFPAIIIYFVINGFTLVSTIIFFVLILVPFISWFIFKDYQNKLEKQLEIDKKKLIEEITFDDLDSLYSKEIKDFEKFLKQKICSEKTVEVYLRLINDNKVDVEYKSKLIDTKIAEIEKEFYSLHIDYGTIIFERYSKYLRNKFVNLIIDVIKKYEYKPFFSTSLDYIDLYFDKELKNYVETFISNEKLKKIFSNKENISLLHPYGTLEPTVFPSTYANNIYDILETLDYEPQNYNVLLRTIELLLKEKVHKYAKNLRKEIEKETKYESHCWRCGKGIISYLNKKCSLCGWYICECGACGPKCINSKYKM